MMLIVNEKLLFKDYIFNKFLEWEKTQPKKRSNFSAFSRWLTDNSYDVIVKQQVVDSWMNGSIPKDHKYVMVLVEKLGDEIYEILDIPRPNRYLQLINKKFEFISEEMQERIANQIAEEAAKYEAKKITDGVSKVPKRGKKGAN